MTTNNPYFYLIDPDILSYENAWLRFQKTGERNASVINDPVWHSWERCQRNGMDPMSKDALDLIPEFEMLNKVSSNQELLSIVSPYINTLFSAVGGAGFQVTFSDSNGIILQSVCDELLRERVDQIHLVPGADMDEELVGTNSINLAIRLKQPISVTGAEHYREIFHNFASMSSPITDYTGTVLGVLTIWGRSEHTTTHILGMLTSSAKAIENEIQIRKINEQLIENNNQMDSILQSVQDGIVYIKDSTIVQINDVFLNFLGRKTATGEMAENVIKTLPEIDTLLKNGPSQFDNRKVTLFCGSKNYNCLVKKRTILGTNEEELGQVLIFILVDEIKKLSNVLSMHAATFTFDDIIGTSPAIKEAKAISERASEHDSRIIIEGESGTGKEMFAQAIHNASSRRNHPFVAIDCGAVPAELFESTLFGYEKGAFTGAKASGSVGALETADNGTLFLDEVENLPLNMQTKLLRTLQEKSVTKVGSSTSFPVNVRIIAATNKNLRQLVDEGTFREDLYYRLNVISITIPPLRDRRTDILPLVNQYLKESSIRNRQITIDAEAANILQNYDWPGNIRQLFNTIERAEIMTEDNTIRVNDLPAEIIGAIQNQPELENHDTLQVQPSDNKNVLSLSEMEHKYVETILLRNNNNVSKTAKQLGITRPTVYRILKQQK